MRKGNKLTQSIMHFILLIVLKGECARSQSELNGCMNFGLIEITSLTDKPVSETLKQQYSCLFTRTECFNSTYSLIYFGNPDSGTFSRYVTDLSTKLKYQFYTEDQNQFIVIDSTEYVKWLSGSGISEVYHAMDSFRYIHGFRCQLHHLKQGVRSDGYSVYTFMAPQLAFLNPEALNEKGEPIGIALETIQHFGVDNPFVVRSGLLNFSPIEHEDHLSIEMDKYTKLSREEFLVYMQSKLSERK